LGHIIISNLSDKEDIHVDVIVSLVKLIMCYAFSVNRDALLKQNYLRLTATANVDVNYGHFVCSSISDFGAARRKAVRRILNIPPDSHNYLITLLLNNALPFLMTCVNARLDLCFHVFSQLDSSLVQSIAKHGIFEGYAAFLCSHFGWQLVNFVYSKTDLL